MSIKILKLANGDEVQRFMLPVPMSGSELADSDTPIPKAIVPGMLYKGHVTLFSGAPKAGKSTLVRDILRRIHESFQTYDPVTALMPDRFVRAERTLILSEESGWAWEEFAQNLEGDSMDKDWLRILHRGHGKIGPGNQDELVLWVDAIIEMVKALGVGLVIIDPVTRFGAITCENDNSEVLRALMSFERIATETGAALLLLHHTTKGGNEPRGCSAWQQQPDAILSLRRLGDREEIEAAEGVPKDRVRILSGKGRFPEIEDTIVCWCDEMGEYKYLPGMFDRYVSKAEHDGETILTAMRANRMMVKGSEIKDATKLAVGPFGRAMRLLVAKNRVLKSGTTMDTEYVLADND